MDSSPLPPVTLEELKTKLKLMLGATTKDIRLEFAVVEIAHQFKIIAIYTKQADRSTFTIDLVPGIPRRFIDGDLPNLLIRLRENFQRFTTTSYRYTTPFEYHTTQTVFYSLVQVHFKIQDTVPPPLPLYPHLLDQSHQLHIPPQPQHDTPDFPFLIPPQPPLLQPLDPLPHVSQNIQPNADDPIEVCAHISKRKRSNPIKIESDK